jgi:hypothetical protein
MVDVDDEVSRRAARLLIARLSAPLAAACAAALVAASLSFIVFDFQGNTHVLRAVVNWVASTLAWSIGGTFLLDMPWHAFAYHSGLRRSSAYWPVGMLVGAAIPASVAIPFGLASTIAPLIVYAAAVGGLSGLLFLLIRRPDRHPPNPPTTAS